MMLTLGIETSCDETGLALLRDGRVLSQGLATQEDLHSVFGGVVPELASREHLRLLPGLLDQIFIKACIEPDAIDLVAVVRGPGLLGGLLVGLGLAKGLCLSTGASLIGVNHLWAHLLAPGLEQELIFPCLGLLVSGGHTHLYLMHSDQRMDLLGQTLDDAAGEAFDKVAKLLNLPYPGGRHIDSLAGLGRVDRTLFPRPYLSNANLDFSFSGLKTAVSQYLKNRPDLRLGRMEAEDEILRQAGVRTELCDLCASFNWTVAETLREKTRRGLEGHPEVRALTLAGGVAANTLVREVMRELAKEFNLPLVVPSPALCTDNPAMVAYAGERLHRSGWFHDLSLEAIPRGRKIPWDCHRQDTITCSGRSSPG